MPVAIRRAVVRLAAEADGPEQQSARSDRSGLEALDAISVSPVPDGPFGQDLRYGAPVGPVNALIHELLFKVARSIHELSTAVEGTWTGPWISVELDAAAPPVDRLERVVHPEQDHDEFEDDPPIEVAEEENEEPTQDSASALRHRRDRK